MNKTARQHKVSKILEANSVTNQATLVELLAAAGVEVNQATVSRDLEELGAIKVRIPGGESAYAIPEMPAEQVAPPDHLRRVLSDWVAEVRRSNDLIVLQTPPGSAHVVASAIDRSGLSDILGTVAGDDTLLIVAELDKGGDVARHISALADLE